MNEEGPATRATRIAAVLCTLSSLIAVLVTRLLGLSGLDVATYAVLTPIVVLGLVGAAPWVRRAFRRVSKPRPPAVLPDRFAP